MNEEYFKKIPLSKKKEFVKKICLIYLKIKLIKKQFIKHKKSNNLSFDKFNGISVFDNILNLMNKNEKLIINNEFLNLNDNTHWYLEHWCKATYYKFKHQTIDKFLFLFFL